MKINNGKYVKNNRRKGFTLVELIVTLAILAIVLSASVFGILAYQKYANYKRNNEYAKTIFAAAQSGLTHYKASGELEDLQELLKDSGHDVNPALFSVDPEDKESLNVTGDRLVYLMIQGGDTSDPFGKALYELLDDYIYDPSVFNASICVEMDVMDGVVNAVCYSDRADSFTYSGEAGSSSGGVMNICDRRESTRKDICLGYYSTALSERAPSSYEKTSIGDVTLVNDEVLDLRFNMTNKYKTLTNNLIYTVRLFDEEKKLKASFDINNTKDSSNQLVKGEETSNNKITTAVTFYDDDGKALPGTKELTFRAYVDTKYIVHLTLDGLDLSAALQTSEKESGAGTSEVSDSGKENDGTYSISRLNLDTDKKIYARLQASGANYKPSAWKQSNSESPYFADSSMDDKEFSIRNARHLFNIRFREAENTVGRYIQKESFAWGGEDGILAAKRVYDKGDTVLWSEGNESAFPAIPSLGQGSTYEGYGKKEVSIQELVLGKDKSIVTEEGGGDGGEGSGGGSTEGGNASEGGDTPVGGDIPEGQDSDEGGASAQSVDVLAADTDESEDEETYGSLGLFCENNGTIRDIVFENAVVDNAIPQEEEKNEEGGEDKEDTKRASGKEKADNPEDSEETGLEKFGTGTVCGINRGSLEKITIKGGSVAGNENVGGIAGKDEAPKKSEDGSAAAGMVRSYTQLENTAGISGIKNVGGILGYNEGSTLTSCTSAPVSLEKDMKKLSENLRGTNVGGIAGYSLGGVLEDCATSGGYVLGKSHVGGIVGLMESPGVDGEESTEKKEVAILDGNGKKNQATVIGEEYVGGITGENKDGIVKGWVNEGIVSATESYAGGIVGYNTGTVENCRTDVDTSAVNGETLLNNAVVWGGTGSYVGGIAGYNNGTIKSGSMQGITVVAAGKDYVGGIVGYNDVKAEITDYKVTGGYISGNCFVSGYAGLNASAQFFDKERISSPNLVKGSWYVGGIAGANLVPAEKDMTLKCDTDNFLGSINAEGAFTGGFIGINALLPATTSDERVAKLGEELAEAAEAESLLEGTNAAKKAVNGSDEDGSGEDKLGKAGFAMNITGSSSSESITSGKSELNQISGAVYTAGIVAYSSVNTELNITKITNKTRVVATGLIEDKTDDLGFGEDKTYSFAGGIIGVAEENVTISECTNKDAGEVTSKGIYLGGLVEVNYGKIIGCDAGNFGENTRSYVGGIAGVNASTGIIGGCSVSGIITGKDNVGGLVSENYGSIQRGNNKECTLTGSVRGYGSNVGGLVGSNMEGARLSSAKSSGTVEGKGTNVGGFAGRNAGSLSDGLENAGKLVQGKANVGGLVGLQEGTENLQSLANKAKVIADDGDAGGIIGTSTGGGYNMFLCFNHGSVNAVKSGNVGGIISKNSDGGVIQKSVNYGTLSAGTGDIGGITAINDGTIQSCNTMSDASVDRDKKVVISGSANIGGIAAINNGMIESNEISWLKIYNKGGNGALGGYAGINNGTLEMSFGSASDVEIYAYTDGTSAGGVAGINKGTIGNENFTFMDWKTQIIVKLQSGDKIQDNVQANLGGIAGINEGEIYGLAFSGTVSGNSAQSYGMGGLAGINGNSSGAVASIRDCDVITDKATAGFVLNIEAGGEMSSISNVGGASGINYQNASISNVAVSDGNIKSKVGYIGGIAGSNYGIVTGCSLGGEETSLIEAFSGNIGGLVGINYGTGQVNNSSVGKRWKITATGNSTGDHAMGGCIGYNESGEDIYGLVNEAEVKKRPDGYNEDSCHSVAGIIGRQEVKVSSTWQIYNCENKGNVTGYARAGGIIGQWKYKGGTIRDCSNSGDITTTGGIAGGILGRFYAMDTGESVVIRNVENYGNVTATGFVAGMIGDSRSSTNLNVTVVDCVNTGSIMAKSSDRTCAGIVDYKLAGNFKILRCRNYGHSASAKFSGIVSSVGASPDVNYCFGVASGSAYPISAKGTLSAKSGNNYYFGGDGTLDEQSEKIEIKTSASSGFSNDGDIPSLYDGTLEKAWRATQTGAGNKDSYIELFFEAPVQLTAVNIYWGTEGNIKDKSVMYHYSLKYRKEIGGDEKVLAEDVAATVNSGEEMAKAEYNLSEPVTAASVILELDSIELYDGPIKSEDYNKIAIHEMEMLGIVDGQQMVSTLSENTPSTYGQEKGDGEELKIQKNNDTNYTAFSEDKSVILRNMPLNPNEEPFKSQADKSREVYNGIDPLIREQYYQKIFGNTPLNDPSDIKGENIGGAYKITWKGDPDAYSTEIYARIYETADSETFLEETTIYVTGQTEAFLSIRDEWVGKYLELSVKSKSMSPDPGYDSREVFAASRYEITAVLPTPEVSFRLTGDIESEVTYTCVLENAEAYGTDQNYEITVKSPYIKYNNSNTIKFNSLDGKIEGVLPVVSTLGSSVNTVAAQAKSMDGKSLSRTSTGQTQMLWKDKLTENDDYVKFANFKGVTEETLEYYMTMSCINSKQLTYRAEYLVWDEAMGIWVAYSSADTYLSSGMTGKAVTLKNLPILPDDMSNVMVRTYPWSSQNDLIKYAYYIAENIEADSIDSLAGAVPEAFAEETEGNRLKAGYDIEKNSDGTYNVIYSLLLESSAFVNQVKSVTFGENTARADRPALSDVYGYDNGWFTFNWDENAAAAGPYTVKLYGYALDGTEVLVYSENDVNDKQISIDGNTWKYKRLRLVVTRKGTLSGDYVNKLYNSAEQSYDVRLPLDTIDRPGSPQLDEATGKNELIYKITWNGINDETQLTDLKGYSVYATDGTDPQLLAEVTADPDTGIIPTEALVDLDIYEGGARLSFYIIANAKEDSVLYRDSATGVMREFTVPTRLEKPSETAVLSPGYAREDGTAEDGIEAGAFENSGLTVAVPNSDSGIKFVMKAAVYDSPDMDGETNEPSGTRLTDIITDGGLDILSLSNNGSEAQYTIKGLSRAYAGQYLFLQFRRTSDSAISSKWSDYQWVRLPRVRLDEPQPGQGVMSDTLIEKQNGSAGEVNKEVIASRPFIEWAQDGLTKKYNIWMKFLGADENTKYPVKLEYIDEVTFNVTIKETELDENNNPVIVDNTYVMQPEATDEEHVNIYSFEFKDFAVDYAGEVETGTTYSIKIPARLQAVVHRRADTGAVEYISYRMILPDVEELHGYRMMRTSYVSIQGAADSEEFYTPSSWEEWVRVQTDQNDIKTNTTVFRNVDSEEKFTERQTGENYYFMNAFYDENLQEPPETPPTETESESESETETETETETNQTETSSNETDETQTEENTQTESGSGTEQNGQTEGGEQTEPGGQTEQGSQSENTQPVTEPEPQTTEAPAVQTEAVTEPPVQETAPAPAATEAFSIQTESQQPAPGDEGGDGSISGTEGTS